MPESKYAIVLLSNSSGKRLELQDSPIGWDKQKFNIVRDMAYFGVFKSLSVEFSFVGDGYRFIQKEVYDYGVDADIVVRVYKRVPYLFLVEGKLNMENYKDARKTGEFKVDILQSSFVQKIQNRENIDLNVRNGLSLDRTNVNPAELVHATIRGRQILFESIFQGSIFGQQQFTTNEGEQIPAQPIGQPQTEFTAYETAHHTNPFQVLSNGNSNVQAYSAISSLADLSEELLIRDNHVFVNRTPINQIIQYDYAVKVYLRDRMPSFSGVQARRDAHRAVFRLALRNDTTDTTTVLQEKEFHGIYGIFSFNWVGSVSVPPNQYLIFYCVRYGDAYPTPLTDPDLGGLWRVEVYYSNTECRVTLLNPSEYPESVTPVVLPFELFTSLVAQITGKDNAVISEFFGRVDLGHDYDGEGALLAITKGAWLRGINTEDAQLATSLRDAYKSYDAVFDLGMVIRENNTIQIEPKSSLLNGRIVTDLGEVKELETTPAKDFLYNSIKTGYPNAEYEKENGRDEFNTEVIYTNGLLAVKKEGVFQSVYRGDGYGVEFARRLGITTSGDSDSRYDEKIFFLDLIRGDYPLSAFTTRRLENILLLEGVFSPETVINGRIAPGQNLLRKQRFLGIPLHRKPKEYYFQTKEKNSQLKVTTLLGESNDRENLVFTQPPFFLPENKIFESLITLEQLFDILDNPLGIIRYTYEGEQFFDHLFEVDSETERATAKWTMLSTRPTPVMIEDASTGEAILKYNDGLTDFVKYGPGNNDTLKYAD